VNLQIFPDVSFLARSAAETFIQFAVDSIQDHGFFTVVLSGGSTPLSMYQVLASEPFSERVDWSKVHFFWGDERCVPPDHLDSNYFRASTNFLTLVPVPEGNIHRIKAELEPHQAAQLYEDEIQLFFSSFADEQYQKKASFDLVLLGLGEDGHTASLFPGTSVINEEVRWVQAVYVDSVGMWRITLTPPLINRANRVLFLVAGSSKSWSLQRVIYGAYQPDRFPAQLIKPDPGKILWLVDEAAAALV
jgi:6-phosphogluconolactonase